MKQVPPVLLNILNERYSAKKNAPASAEKMDDSVYPSNAGSISTSYTAPTFLPAPMVDALPFKRGSFSYSVADNGIPNIDWSSNSTANIFPKSYPSPDYSVTPKGMRDPLGRATQRFGTSPTVAGIEPLGGFIAGPETSAGMLRPVSPESPQLKLADADTTPIVVEPIKTTTATEYDFPIQKPSVTQKIQNIGNVASNITKEIGKFGIGAYAGSYPFEMVYNPVYTSSQEYVPEPVAHAAGVVTGTAAAIPASEIAVVGIPETARTIARARELGLLGRTSLGLRAGTTATGKAIQAAGRAAPFIGAAMILAPYVWEADKEDAAKRAEMLQRFETKKENEAAIRKSLGFKQEESWLDTLKDNFAKAMILGGDRGIMAAGRQ